MIKTSSTPVGWAPARPVVLLVRDGRDAVLSLYHNLRSFSGLTASVSEYLAGGNGAWLAPARSWGFFCSSWLGAVAEERLHVLRFESAREDPLRVFRDLCDFLGVARDDVEIRAAIEASSYSRMRAAESDAIARRGASIGTGRVMRRGRVGGWRDECPDEMRAAFRGLAARALASFGYGIDEGDDDDVDAGGVAGVD